jgi:hypothetical protein
MANVVHLTHLEHIEDEMLNYGVDGCHAAVRFMRELLKMLGEKKGSGYMQTKWDGSPSVVCGWDPESNDFFVANKSAFNVGVPKIAYNNEDIEQLYGTGGLAYSLKECLKYFPRMNIKGVVQGDVLFTDRDKKIETIDGIKYVTFRLNTLTYAIPFDHPLAKKAIQAKVGVVFHTHYQVPKYMDPSAFRAMAGADVPENNDLPEVCQIFNDTPMAETAVSETILSKFARNTQVINRMCAICGPFLNNLVSNMSTTGDKKYHVASYLKQFFNDEVRNQRNISSPQKTYKALGEFYYGKMTKVIDGLKSPKAKTEKRALMYAGLKYLEIMETQFNAMLTLYKKMQENKQLVIDELDRVENLGPVKYFVKTKNGYEVTNPEGYVMHLDGDMIKLVNRLEFSYNNFTVEKDWK